MKTVKWRHEYQASSWAIDHVSLHFKIDPQTTDVINKMSVRKVGTENSLFLDGEDLELVALFVDGQPFPYQKTDFGLGLELTQNQAEIEIHTRIHPTQNTTLSGLYSSGTTVCTQCEAEGFRRITYFQDRPDVLSRYTTIIEADKARFPYLLANGNCTQEKDLENGRWQVTWTDPFPKPCYLFALVGGDFDLVEGSFQTKSQREIQLRVFTEKGQGSKASFALECLKRSMAWDEQRFGLEYDLDTYMIVAVSDFNFGAMENKGLNVFNTKYVLADPTISTDQDFIQVESVIGHEYFHNWTGNRVTCRDWFQLSLKEGLTVFRDQEFTSDLHSRPVKRIQDVRIIRTAQFAEDASPMAHPIRPDSYIEMNNFYTVTVYNKGAEVIRMIHTLIGETAFQAGMKTYFERHDGQAVTCEDFVRAMEAGSGQDLTQFRRWYSQPGTPTVRVEHIYDESSKRFELTLHQSCPTLSNYAAPEPFHIPIKMGFLNTKGETLAARLSGSTHAEEWVLSLTAPQQTFVFEVDEKPIVSILRDFSAPIKLEIERSTDERALLWAHDPNLFNRWEAGQAYFCEAIQHGVAHGADAVAHWVPNSCKLLPIVSRQPTMTLL